MQAITALWVILCHVGLRLLELGIIRIFKEKSDPRPRSVTTMTRIQSLGYVRVLHR